MERSFASPCVCVFCGKKNFAQASSCIGHSWLVCATQPHHLERFLDLFGDITAATEKAIGLQGLRMQGQAQYISFHGGGVSLSMTAMMIATCLVHAQDDHKTSSNCSGLLMSSSWWQCQ